MRRTTNILLVALLSFNTIDAAMADVRLPGMFSDAMVLQQGVPLPVWGWADPGEKVVVAIEGHEASTTTNNDGKWHVTLQSLKADGRPLQMTIHGRNTIVIRDALVGEVWLCSGQSNMAMGVKYCLNAKDEIAGADFPQLRIYNTRSSPSPVRQTDHHGKWLVCSPHNIGEWTAVGFFFARYLHKKLGVPVGLINASKGSVPIQTFMSIQSLKVVPSAKADLEVYEKRVKTYLEYRNTGKGVVDTGTTQNGEEPPGNAFNDPEAFYNSSIFPLAPYALRGAVWYQGEGHANDVCDQPDYYAQALPALITDWRKVWHQGDFPFIVVQLPNFKRPQEVAINQGWSDFREAQCRGVRAVKNAGIVTTIDIGEAFNIHPKNKQDVGKRLARWALANVYHEKGVMWSGPKYKTMKIESYRIRIAFDHVGGGLRVKGKTPGGFAIADANKVFRFAKARIDGDDVVVWSDKIQEPVAVRYAWAENPVCNLFNDADLPAMPFRTDDWAISEVKAAEDEQSL